jgi:phosphopantetheine binding protein
MDETPSVEAIAEELLPLWSTALGTQAAVDSDFFTLGGNSLAAVAIATAIAERHANIDGLELIALEAMFATASLLEMARALRDAMLAPPDDGRPAGPGRADAAAVRS